MRWIQIVPRVLQGLAPELSVGNGEVSSLAIEGRIRLGGLSASSTLGSRDGLQAGRRRGELESHDDNMLTSSHAGMLEIDETPDVNLSPSVIEGML